ncbi:transglutaminase [Methanosphaera sp. BMS]|nr:transglutaminase [Methanosphaera sp. BMS]
MEEYLIETPSIDYMNSHIQEKVQEFENQSNDEMDYIKRSYEFVRDEIPHSWDIGANIVSKTASDVLINKTGICWTKSCLFAALLRAKGIPSGISYQLLTIADDDSEGHMIHALNTVYVKDLKKWVRLDARGNIESLNTPFSLDKDCLAFQVRSELGEIDYMDNHADLDERLVNILSESDNLFDINIDFKF